MLTDADRDHQHAQRRRRARRASCRLRAQARPDRPRRGRCRSSPRPADGLLNDINGIHVRPEHVVRRARRPRRGGPVAEGNVGGGTGMICHEFKGGIGTASRVLPRRTAATPSACWSRPTTATASGCGSTACRSVARSARRGLGLPATGPRSARACSRAGLDHRRGRDRRAAPAAPVRAARPARHARHRPGRRGGEHDERRPLPGLLDRQRAWRSGDEDDRAHWTMSRGRRRRMDALFDGAIEATEEAIVNALVAAETMAGRRRQHRPRPAARSARRDHDPVRAGSSVPPHCRRVCGVWDRPRTGGRSGAASVGQADPDRDGRPPRPDSRPRACRGCWSVDTGRALGDEQRVSRSASSRPCASSRSTSSSRSVRPNEVSSAG